MKRRIGWETRRMEGRRQMDREHCPPGILKAGIQSPAAPAPNNQRAGAMRTHKGIQNRRLIFFARCCCWCHVGSCFAAISNAFLPIKDSNSSSFQRVPRSVVRQRATRTQPGASGKMPKRESRSAQPTRPDVMITGRGFTGEDNTP